MLPREEASAHAATTTMPTESAPASDATASSGDHFAVPLLWRTDATGALVAGEGAWATYAGMAADLLVGFGWLSAVHPDDRVATRAAWEQGTIAQTPFEIEHRLIGGDGLARPFLTQAQPELDATGSLLGWHCLSMDISRVRAHEDALLQAFAEREAAWAAMLALTETSRRMHEFLSVASHELRTPLTAMRANVQIATKWLTEYLLEHAPHEARLKRVRDLLLRADQNTQRLDDLVSDLLDVTRIQKGRLVLRRVPTDLAQIVRDAVQEQRIIHPDRTITLKIAATPVTVEADPLRIGQVVTNFLTNALKYSPAEEPVAVRVRLLHGVARVDVQDHGQGLPRGEQARVWQPFYRVPGIVVLYGSGVGLGLGLNICKSIIERHKGRVGITSTPKRGATFWFQLPLSDTTPPPPKRETDD